MDVAKTIAALEQALREIEGAIAALKNGDSKTTSFALDDVEACLRAAREDLGRVGA